MGLLSRLMGGTDLGYEAQFAATPSSVWSSDRLFGDEIWAQFFQPASIGTAEHAARLSAVQFCLSLIAESVGSLSLDILEGDTPVEDFELSDILAYRPNSIQTGAEFWASMAYRAALAGYSFAEPVITESLELWPLAPSTYSVDWSERSFKVTYAPEGGKPQREMGPNQLFWICGLADAAMKPLCPWQMAKGTMDFALALESQGKTFFQNGTRISGVLHTDQKLSPEAIGRLKQGVREWKNGQIPVFEQGLSYQAVQSTNTDAQMVELIRQRTLEMARYWRIPKSMVGEDGGTAASQEQQALEFVKYTIRPWVRRIEQAISNRLMTPDQRARYRAKFNLDSLLRGDSATQVKNAMIIRNMAAGSVNDVRTRILGWPKINEAWADDPREPLNSNRAADTQTGGQTAPQDMVESENG